jgi:ribosomal protein S25
MKHFVRFITLLSLLPLSAGLAQNQPHVGYVYPAGGKQGSTFRVTIGGQFLGGATNLIVSEGGVSSEVLDYFRPLTQREFKELKEKADQLRQKRQAMQSKQKKGGAKTWTAADEKLIEELRKKLANFQRRPPNPAIAETVTVQMSIAPDATPGTRELRLRTPTGLSNPMVFKVGVLPEVSEKPEKTAEERPSSYKRPVAETPVNPPEIKVTVPVIVNGQIMAGDVDRVKFRARAGQHLVIAASARELVPYLPDAVPGWFQATLTLFDPKGKEIAYDDDFRFHPDPVLLFNVPQDGEYAVEIRDSIFRGREDFVYRLEISESPFITGIFPLGAHGANAATVSVTGWNLREPKLNVPATGLKHGVQMVQTEKEGSRSNPVPFQRGSLPEVLEAEPNQDHASAQTIRIGTVVNGRMDAAGDVDVYKFSGKAGTRIIAEVSARRLNSPLDSLLKLIGPNKQQLALNDDFDDKAFGLTTHQADSMISFTLPADGNYLLEVSDAQRKGGPEYAYRLRLSEPQPDFELRVVPSTVNIRAGSSVPLTVYALRKDGFDGDIRLELEAAQKGFTLGGGRIPGNAEKVQVTLTAPPGGTKELMPIHIEGSAIIGKQLVTRPAVPSEDMMQAFFYRHLVPSREMLVCVNGSTLQRIPLKIVSETPVKIPSGGTVTVRLTVPKYAMSRAKLSLADPPEGITIQKVGEWASGAEITLACEEKAKPGLRGNLIFEPAAKTSNNKSASGKSGALGSLPAVPFEVVAR